MRYIAGCRCDDCRKANSAYERERQKARKTGDWNGIIDATNARKHLLRLSAAGIGRRAVSAATDLSCSIVFEIRTGQRTKIRSRTERLILAVSPKQASDHALIPSGPTWRLVNALLSAGFTKSQIALELNGTKTLQLSKAKVTVRKAARLKLIFNSLMASESVLVSAEPTKKRIANLRAEGYSNKHLARLLDFPEESLDLKMIRVPRGLENKVVSLHDRLMA